MANKNNRIKAMGQTHNSCCQPTGPYFANSAVVNHRQANPNNNNSRNIASDPMKSLFIATGRDPNVTSCPCFRWNNKTTTPDWNNHHHIFNNSSSSYNYNTNGSGNYSGGSGAIDSISPPDYVYAYMTLASVVIFLAGVLGNLLVIYAVVRLQSMRTRMNLYLVSLSVADLMVLMVCQPVALMDLYGKERWFLGAFMCKLIPYLENTAVHSSGLCLLAISQERYLAICRPLSVVRRRHTCMPNIAITWLLSLLPCLPFIFISQLNQVPYYDGSYQPMCRTKTSLPIIKVFLVVDFVLCLLLPLTAITFFYISILCALSHCRRHREHVHSCTGGSDPHIFRRSRGKVVKMMVTVVVLFYACLLPMRSLAVWTVFVSPERLIRMGFESYLNLMNVARLLIFVNSAANPVIYGLMSSKFRNAFVRALPVLGLLPPAAAAGRKSPVTTSCKVRKSRTVTSRQMFSMSDVQHRTSPPSPPPPPPPGGVVVGAAEV